MGLPFTLRQIEEQIEKPTAELHQRRLEVVERAVKDEEDPDATGVISVVPDVIAESWRARDPSRMAGWILPGVAMRG
ncbi:glutathionylspermidine synthase family protein [Escherichia coli]